MIKKLNILTVITVLLSGCGFTAMHANNPKLNAETAEISIKPIDGELGILMRNTLRNTLTPKGIPSNPKYSLSIKMNEPLIQKKGVREDSTATWGTVIITAQYTLTEISTNETILKDSQKSYVSYNISKDVYSTMLAEEDSKKRATKTLSEQMAAHITATLSNKKKK